MWNDVKEGISCQLGFVLYMHTNSVEVSHINIYYWIINNLSNHDIKCAEDNNDRKRGWLDKRIFKFNIVEDKDLLVHAGLVVPTAGWPTKGNILTTKTKTEDPWVNGIMMILIAYRYLCFI